MLRRILLLLVVLLLVPGMASARDDSDVHLESDVHGGNDGDPGGGDLSPSRIQGWFETESPLYTVSIVIDRSMAVVVVLIEEVDFKTMLRGKKI